MNNKIIDQETFNAFKQGHQTAQKLVFYDVYEGLVYFSLTIVKDFKEAQDISIETYTKMYPGANGKDDYSSFRAALYTAVRNRSINFYHRKMNRTFSIDETCFPEPSEETISSWMAYGEMMKIIVKDISGLKGAKKLVAEYIVFNHMTPKEIAAELNMPVQTVRNIRAELRKMWEKLRKRKNLPLLILF